MTAQPSLRCGITLVIPLKLRTRLSLFRLVIVGLLITTFAVTSAGGQPAQATIRHVPLAGANHVVYDQARGVLYASVSGPQAGVYPIDPVTGAVGAQMASGATYRLAIADDDSYLYAGQQSAVSRIDLATRSVDLTFPIPYAVEDMQVRPGHPDTVAIS